MLDSLSILARARLEVYSAALSAPTEVLAASLILATLLAVIFLCGSSGKKKASHRNAPRTNGMDESAYDGSPLSREDFLTMGVPPEPHLEGGFLPATEILYSNASNSFPFENEHCSGHFLPLHRPTYDRSLDKSGKYPYGDHFTGKKRIWEMRWQMKFKRRPTESELFFGVECEEYVPLSAATKRVMDITVGMLRQAVGDSLYHSPGDDPNEVQGEAEKPGFMMPLWALDQFIVTPEGEEPPSLTEPGLEDLGEKRVGRVRDYKKAIDELDLRPGPTYTFFLWGISRNFDVLQWEVLGIPIVTPLDINLYCGSPPIYLVFYTLKDGNEGTNGEKRHLASRKEYWFRCGFWSSEKRPPQALLEQFLGKSLNRLRGLRSPRRGQNGVSRQNSSSMFGSLFQCCVTRECESEMKLV